MIPGGRGCGKCVPVAGLRTQTGGIQAPAAAHQELVDRRMRDALVVTANSLRPRHSLRGEAPTVRETKPLAAAEE